MKSLKLFLLSTILLLGVGGSVFATTIPDATEPKEGGPDVWLQSVYNNSGSTMDVGDVAIWDGDSSTGDDDNWVTTTTTADTYLVAGVVYPANIAAGASGTIAIRGPVQTDQLTGLNAVKGLACSSTTAGSAKTCDTNAANFGIVVTAAASNSAIVCVRCNQ